MTEIGNKRRAVMQISLVARAWHQPCFTGEANEGRHQLALSMIREITQWALHPGWGDNPPYVERTEP